MHLNSYVRFQFIIFYFYYFKAILIFFLFLFIREQHLNEVQERLKAREEHAKKVRKRKEMIASGFNYVPPNQTEQSEGI